MTSAGRKAIAPGGRMKKSISLTKADVSLLAQLSEQDNNSVSEIIRKAIRQYFFLRCNSTNSSDRS